MLNNIN